MYDGQQLHSDQSLGAGAVLDIHLSGDIAFLFQEELSESSRRTMRIHSGHIFDLCIVFKDVDCRRNLGVLSETFINFRMSLRVYPEVHSTDPI